MQLVSFFFSFDKLVGLTRSEPPASLPLNVVPDPIVYRDPPPSEYAVAVVFPDFDRVKPCEPLEFVNTGEAPCLVAGLPLLELPPPFDVELLDEELPPSSSPLLPCVELPCVELPCVELP